MNYNNNIIIKKININNDHWSSNWIPISYINSLNNNKINKSTTYLWSIKNEVNGIARAYYINSKQIEIADIWINPKYRGKIYKKKSDNKYSYEFLKKVIYKIFNDYKNIVKITLLVSNDNIPAIKLYDKLGFKIYNTKNINLIKINNPIKMVLYK